MSKEYRIDGNGYYWKTELMGGPFDGLQDRVVELKNSYPPLYIFRKVDSEQTATKRTKLGHHILEIWAKPHLPKETSVAVYKIRGNPKEVEENDECKYDFIEVTTLERYVEQYESK